MKIILDTGSYLPVVGGVQIVVHNLATGLVKAGHDVIVTAYAGFNDVRIDKNYQFINLSKRGHGYFRKFKVFRKYINYNRSRLIRKFNPDIIHSHYLYPNGYDLFQLMQRHNINIPFIITAHGIDIQVDEKINYGYRLNPVKKDKIQQVAGFADGLISISNSVLREYGKFNIDQNKVVHIPNPISYNTFVLRNNLVSKRSMGFDQDVPILLAVGRNHPKKNYHDLLRIIKILKEQNEKFKCIIIGKNVSDFISHAKVLEIEDMIQFIDFKKPAGLKYKNKTFQITDKIENYYSIADVFVITSRVESFGLITAEAMAAGKPVVGMNAPGTECLINDGVNGYLIDQNLKLFAQRIDFLLKNKQARKAMGDTGRKMAQKYSIENITQRHLELYQQIIAKQRKMS